jgi:hypothetical protein
MIIAAIGQLPNHVQGYLVNHAAWGPAGELRDTSAGSCGAAYIVAHGGTGPMAQGVRPLPSGNRGPVMHACTPLTASPAVGHACVTTKQHPCVALHACPVIAMHHHPHAFARESAPIGVVAKFAASAWGKKLARQTAKASTNDFDRFKSTIAKVKKARVVRKVINQLKKAAQKK